MQNKKKTENENENRETSTTNVKQHDLITSTNTLNSSCKSNAKHKYLHLENSIQKTKKKYSTSLKTLQNMAEK